MSTEKESQTKKKLEAIQEAIGRKLHMRRLIDYWSPAVAVLFSFIKALQGLNKIGIKTRDNGWRIATRAYLNTEHSKFALAVFRLALWKNEMTENRTLAQAQETCIRRLISFFEKQPESHWEVVWTVASVYRKRKHLVDIVHADFKQDGTLSKIQPYFDARSNPAKRLTHEQRLEVNALIVSLYNEVINFQDAKRPYQLKMRLYLGIIKYYGKKGALTPHAYRYVDRVLSATFISFERLPERSTYTSHERFKTPHFIRRKHPGYGLCNIVCRFTRDLAEADIWMQYNHVPVDGVPMQEMLTALKRDWGSCGNVVFPSLKKKYIDEPELCSTHAGASGVYHVRRFINFAPMLAKRKELIAAHGDSVVGDITVVGMLIWGLAQTRVFRDQKFLVTVEIADEKNPQFERRPGVVFIRPKVFFNDADPAQGFIDFHNEFNIRLHATRARKSESYELLELFTMTSPWLYKLIKKLAPKAMTEFLGTIGVTMIRDSEVFITPLSDIHTGGFIALGNMAVPTEDGDTAGSVSFRGPRESITAFVEALEKVSADYCAY